MKKLFAFSYFLILLSFNSFAQMLGGLMFPSTRYAPGSVFCESGPTEIVDVTNPITGQTWMDRNLGASRAATSSNDTLSFGDLYQWGRGNDGHQCRNSTTTTTLSTTNQPSHGSFILTQVSPVDWRRPQNNYLWQGVNGINNPCPIGYRVPTDMEFEAERLSWSSNNSAGAFDSPLKLPRAGVRSWYDGLFGGEGIYSQHWSSTLGSFLIRYPASRVLAFNSNGADLHGEPRASGLSVRCLKDGSSLIPARIGAIDCLAPTVTGTLIANTASSNVSATLSYTSGNGGIYEAQSLTSTGVTGLTATLNAGVLADGSGTLTYVITGTPSASGIASFSLNLGGESCTFTVNIASSTHIDALNCSSPVINGFLLAYTEASDVSATISYIGGNGGSYEAQSLTSTGVTGLTATLNPGALEDGSGSLTYIITGTPITGGTAIFNVIIGGQSCSFYMNVALNLSELYPPASVFCAQGPSEIVNRTFPETGKTWMDRNLGASKSANNVNDNLAYGDLYQWGRGNDGHQCRNSLVTNFLSSSDNPLNGFFINTNISPYDWRSPQNDNLWQGVNGINNPCPIGYRVPTFAELYADMKNLNLTEAGKRDGPIIDAGSQGYYWSSTVSGIRSRNVGFQSGTGIPDGVIVTSYFISSDLRFRGFSVRCIKD